MPFLRLHGRQIHLLHGYRQGGRIRHRCLHRFHNSSELAAVLDGPAWEQLQQSLGEAHPEVAFDWPRLAAAARDLLAESPARPTDEPQEERILALRRTLRHLHRELDTLRLDADRSVLLAIGHDLRDTAYYGIVLLNGLSGASEEKGRMFRNAMYQMLFPDEVTEGLVERARADFHAGRLKKARERFAEARNLDPLDPDVLTSEANCHLSVGALDCAEPLYREALALARHRIPLGRRVLGWGELEVRPYARAAHGLALVHEKRGEHREAIQIWLELTTLCPDDGVGVRFCLGPAYHRVGDLDTAMDWYARHPEFPEQLYNLAAALHAKGDLSGTVEALLEAVIENPYIPLLLLGEPAHEADVWHGSNTQGLEWAQDYVERDRDLWTKPALVFLGRVWTHSEVQEAMNEVQAARRALNTAPAGSTERSRLVDALFSRERALLAPDAVTRLMQAVKAVSATGAGPKRRGRAHSNTA